MKQFLSWQIVALAVTFVIGPLTYLVVKYIKDFWIWLDRQPATLQRVFVLVVAFGLTAGAQMAGLALPSECALIGDGLVTGECKSAVGDPVFVKSVLGALLAMLMHRLKQSEPRS